MIRPMNDWELNLHELCNALPGCGEPATHCESEVTDYPLFLCTMHALQQAMIHGGAVRMQPPAEQLA